MTVSDDAVRMVLDIKGRVFTHHVRAEVRKARAKFPGANKNLAALVEEVGELAKAMLDEDNVRVWQEAVQVAAMALRCATEGDHSLKMDTTRSRFNLLIKALKEANET
jgi:hypothetical protein